MIEIFSKFEPKDFVALIVGSIALIVSASTLMYNVISKSVEAKRAARDDFADTIEKLVELRKEREDVRIEAQDNWASYKYATMRGALNDRRQLLISRSYQLIDDYNLKATNVEFLILGSAHMDAGHLEDAITCFNSAIEEARTDLLLAWALRSHSIAMIRAGAFDVGRQDGTEAAEIYLRLANEEKQDTLRLNYLYLETILRLVQSELIVQQYESALQDFELLKQNLDRSLFSDDRISINGAIQEIEIDIERRMIDRAPSR